LTRLIDLIKDEKASEENQREESLRIRDILGAQKPAEEEIKKAEEEST